MRKKKHTAWTKRKKREEIFNQKKKNEEKLDIRSCPKLYYRYLLKVKELGINPEMPGHDLIIRAMYVTRMNPRATEEWVYEHLNRTTLVPALREVATKGKPAAKQWIHEALKSVGIDDEPMQFIRSMI